MKESSVHSFLSTIIDWRDFELFVAEMYKQSDDVIVEHNVTEIGKYGDKRQIDVRVIQKDKLHTTKTIIECKFWKSKVDRGIVDVVVAAVDDLNANRGVIFTTVGYEEGAKKYAEGKNIDIFTIRDVRADEWGEPGRHIYFYIQCFYGLLQNIAFENIQYISINGSQAQGINLSLNISKDANYDSGVALYSGTNSTDSKYLNKIIIECRNKALEHLSSLFSGIMQPDGKHSEQYYTSKVTVDFTNYKYRAIRDNGGLMVFDKITFDLIHLISQSKFEFDRASSSDFVLIVENYITNQKNFVSRVKNENKVVLSNPIKKKEDSSNDALQNGSVLKILMEPYVHFDIPSADKIHNGPPIIINLANE
ncbi:MAG TPA: restriction endonuclease [Flavipsychrobacter sp.]|nr:restriction endonuclease [Flavipsychrobacter sp.]